MTIHPVEYPVSGPVERGLRSDLRKRGVKANGSTLAASAVQLARRIDRMTAHEGADFVDDKELVSAMRELRLTVAAIFQQPGDATDDVSGLQDKAKGKLS
jgi:hypothetical protein